MCRLTKKKNEMANTAHVPIGRGICSLGSPKKGREISATRGGRKRKQKNKCNCVLQLNKQDQRWGGEMITARWRETDAESSLTFVAGSIFFQLNHAMRDRENWIEWRERGGDSETEMEPLYRCFDGVY